MLGLGWAAGVQFGRSAYRWNREVKDRCVLADAVGVGGLWDGDAALLERPSDGDLRLGLAQLVGDGEERRVLEALRAGDGAVALRATNLPLSPAENPPRTRSAKPIKSYHDDNALALAVLAQLLLLQPRVELDLIHLPEMVTLVRLARRVHKLGTKGHASIDLSYGSSRPASFKPCRCDTPKLLTPTAFALPWALSSSIASHDSIFLPPAGLLRRSFFVRHLRADKEL